VTPHELEPILRRTLTDGRLSGSERQALAVLLDERRPDDQQLGVLRHRAFELACEQLQDPRAVQMLGWLHDVLKTLQRRPETAATASEAHFSPGDACFRRIVGLFQGARRSVDVCVFTITDDRISAAILDAHRRGVALRVLTDNEKEHDPGSDVERLRSAGVPLRVDRTPYHMHHKYAIFDGRLLLNGSYNWTRGAAENNEENLTVTDDRRLVQAFQAAFEKLWAGLAT
jgi:mitochondrial cardiolipin hydrolase